MKRCDFYLSDELSGALERARRAMELNKSGFIRLAIRDLLQTEGFLPDTAGLRPPARLVRKQAVRRQKEPAELTIGRSAE